MSQFGPSYEREADQARLRTQMLRVRDFMLACAITRRWKTLEEICRELERNWPGSRFPAASVSAQLRHLRKPQFGGYRLEKRRRGAARRGLWEYALFAPAPPVGTQSELRFPGRHDAGLSLNR